MSSACTAEGPFSELAYLRAFERHRVMPPDLLDTYYELLDIPQRSVGTLLDVGSGPGLQAQLLLERIPRDWRIVALEPSGLLFNAGMRRLREHGNRITLRNISFLDEPQAAVYDAVWMSEVVHLLGKPEIWVTHLRKLMRVSGRALIRTSTHEQLQHRQWYDYFPRAREVDLIRHPSRRELVEALEEHDFQNVRTTTVSESRTERVDAVIARLESKSLSTLHYLSIDEHDEGMAKVRRALSGCRTVTWDYTMTAYTATASALPL